MAASDTGPGPETGTGRPAVFKAAGLVAVLALAGFVGWRYGLPDVALLRERVASAGALGPAVFVTGYALAALLPVPKSVLTALGGTVFGLPVGAALSLVGALVGAVVAFALSRLLGREAVEGLVGRRLAPVDTLLRGHGVLAVLALRLTPVVPYTALNYAAGLTAVSWGAFVLGSALGMVPGSVAYAALGAYAGTDPRRTALAVAGLVVLVVLGGAWGRRLVRRRTGDPVGGGVGA